MRNKTLKIILLILTITFLWQQVGCARPDLFYYLRQLAFDQRSDRAELAGLRPLRFGDELVWRDEEGRTSKIVTDAIAFLEQRKFAYSASYPGLFSDEVVTAKIAHLRQMLEGIKADMAGQHAGISVAQLKTVDAVFQRKRFGRIMWGADMLKSSWKDLPYNVAQSIIFSEVAWATGFFDAPDNPLTDFYKEVRDKRQEQDLLPDGRPILPIYTKFVLGGHTFSELSALSKSDKQAVLQRALLLSLKGNALDPSVLGKLKVQGVGLDSLTLQGIVINDSSAMVNDITDDKVNEVVLFQDNVGVEFIGLAIFTAVYTNMYPDKKVTWCNKPAAYFTTDVVRRDVEGWRDQVSGMDGRGWFERIGDAKYNPGQDQNVQTLLTFLSGIRTQSDKFEVLTHPWTESGLLGNDIPEDLSSRVGGENRVPIAVGEWLSERFTNGIPYPRGTSYEAAWGYLRSKGIYKFGLLRMIKDAFIIVIPDGQATGVEITEGGRQGVVSFARLNHAFPIPKVYTIDAAIAGAL